MITATALKGLPEIRDGDDLATLILGLETELRDGDVLAVAHKVVSKAEGRVVELSTVSPGRRDSHGRELQATAIAIADEAAAAADLSQTKDSREPVVVVRGLERHVSDDDGPGAAALLRDAAEDLFL